MTCRSRLHVGDWIPTVDQARFGWPVRLRWSRATPDGVAARPLTISPRRPLSDCGMLGKATGPQPAFASLFSTHTEAYTHTHTHIHTHIHTHVHYTPLLLTQRQAQGTQPHGVHDTPRPTFPCKSGCGTQSLLLPTHTHLCTAVLKWYALGTLPAAACRCKAPVNQTTPWQLNLASVFLRSLSSPIRGAA
ncbi:hypothetical protein VTI28DRAFT_6302 [Corynascus sepedonium]